MGRLIEDITDCGFIGNTPLYRLKKIMPSGSGCVYVKLEDLNPGGSIKSRIAFQMIVDAEKQGLLRPYSGQTIIEPTGGNTGAGLAMLGAMRGYKVILVMPDNYSKQKVNVLRAYGADVVLSDSKKGNDSHVQKVREIKKENPEYVWLDQFTNLSNTKAHYDNTGREIIEDLRKVDCFVAGIGSGGTISGVGKRIRENFPSAQIVGVQPEGCDVLNGKGIPHKIEGLAVGVPLRLLDVSLITKMVTVKNEEAIFCSQQLSNREGLLVGISSGANVFAAMKMAEMLGPGKNVVTVAPDSGRNYLGTIVGCD